MPNKATVPLVLGGHSFIQQLGNDPAPDVDEQIEIVSTCLDAGITWFDTTYQPERVALGTVLKALGRRDEATIIAWNFFVGMHRVEWVSRNIQSLARGPLAAEDRTWLELLASRALLD